MIDNIIKAATCLISCGNELGTGHLIADCKVLTARHCVIKAIESDCPITLTFTDAKGDIPAELFADSEEMDACILSISQPLERQPIPIDAEMPREGSDWRSFGYPSGKTIIGHRITGIISHLLDTPKLKMNVDLTVDPTTSLQDYQGLSGAAFISEGASRGMIRVKMDRTLGAISLQRLAGFLAENGIQMPPPTVNESVSSESGSGLADRSEFQETFEQIIVRNPGDYIFLEGAHGIGKTTFCNEFVPDDQSLFTLGTYSLVTQERGPGAIYRVQPDVFFDWLSTAVSILVTGKNSRKEERSYPQLVDETSVLLEAFSNYCVSTHRHGILFLDGLNEGQVVDSSALIKLIGLLPQSLPKMVTIVLTAPNHHSVASSIAGRVKSENIISLPLLTEVVVSAYCWQELAKDTTPALVAQICEKAQGHPLYLRYLIEYANNKSEINSLDNFPTLTGTIEQYYELIWQRLLEDADAINLLAIIARLRWGIEKNDILKVLTSREQTVFTPTISRIQHLLLNPPTTTIYHPSFTAFIISKTDALESVIQERLAAFCVKESRLEYGVLNVVFHLLRSDDADRSQAVVTCKQKWVDTCVSLGIEPDTLLFDIEATLAVAANFGQAVEVVRLLLLSQRVSFRYNTLFTQSAQLIAEALIALKRPREALKHAIRFNTLIVAPDEALQIAFCFIQHEYREEALELLGLLYQKILEVYTSLSGGFELRDFIYLSKLHLRTLFFMRLTDGQGRMNQILGFLEHVRHVLNTTLNEESPELLHESYVRVSCVFMCYFLCFRDTYPTLDERKKKMGEPVPLSFLLDIIFALFEYEESIEKYNLPNEITSLPLVFSDIEELLATGANFDRQLVPAVVDTLIQLGAPSSLVHLIANKGDKLASHPFKIKADNGVDVDFFSIQQGAAEWRIEAFLKSDSACPLVGAFDETGWLSSLNQLICALYWCEGKARRAKADGNESLLLQTQEFFKTRVLLPLDFTLAQRVKWQDSYAIPEKTFPLLYERITLVLIDCYPKYLSEFLQILSERADDQCGLYTEGFREVMCAVLQKLTIREIEPSLFDKVFSLLQQWKDHVISGVENRHELVPELLRMIPLFVKVGACEEAEELYRYMLGVSMGPSWYKEDQLGLMVSVLHEMPISDNVQAMLPRVAGFLERASGEMTFQRFIQYKKQAFLGELFRQGRFVSGCRYFKRQVCGTMGELLSESQDSPIDKVSPMIGMRHPGGALDEQDAILKIVQNTEGIDWHLRWALLEMFQCGDERHLEDYATEYAKLINLAGIEAATISEMVNRMKFVIWADINPEDRSRFHSSFSKALDTVHHPAFSRIFSQISNTDLRHEKNTPVAKVDTDTVVSASHNPDSQNRDDLYFPGIFGRESATKEADAVLVTAERHLKLRNLEAAKNQAVEVLQILQAGGWSIWGNLSESSTRAETLLLEGAESAADVIRFYAPLLEAEQHESKWSLAEHLITKVTDLLSEDERSKVLKCIIKHIRLMVGDATNEIAMFSFMSEEPPCNPSIELFRLVLWHIDHPHQLRRDKAAGLTAWLVESDPAYFEEAVNRAFSIKTGYSADILCGVLYDMSTRQPLHLWDRVVVLLDLESVLQNCRHVGRLTVLHRIAERAAKAGSITGAKVVSRVMEQFRSGTIELGASGRHFDLPPWANCILQEWEMLTQLGVASAELFNCLEENLTKLCKPLDIHNGYNLEKAVSSSFREAPNILFNRWEGKVRFALSTALFPYVTHLNFSKIELALRIFNPSLPERTLTPGFVSPAEDAICSISNGKNYAGATGNSDFFFLNYHEITGDGENDSRVYIEILAVVIPASYVGLGLFLPPVDTSFSSKELPDFKSVPTPHETCCHLKPDFACFGTFTPAVPLSSFTELIKASKSDFLRINWRDGRSNDLRYLGRPMKEGCLLAVKRTAVCMPDEKKLAWIIRMNGETVTMVDSQNNPLYKHRS